MAHYNFNKDIYEGEKGEKIVIQHLKKLGGKLINDNKDNKFDVIIEKNGKKIKYEIKTDVFCNPFNDTGNIFVEVECRGKKSGIMVSQADWFVTYFKHFEQFWYIKTIDIINLINQNQHKLQFISNGGDYGSNTKGWLIPRKEFINSFLVYDSKTYNRIHNHEKTNQEKTKKMYDKLANLLNKKLSTQNS